MNALAVGVAAVALISCGALAQREDKSMNAQTISGLTGTISDIRIAVPAPEQITSLASSRLSSDIDLRRMAEWAMNYLTETPRKDLGYEPVFQCHPLACPPLPRGQDPVVACDTDARMDWEWYYMREIAGSNKGRDVEAAFHKRMRDYIDPDGKVWSHPGCYNEGKTDARYKKEDYVIHIWGATKILQSLSEDYARTGNPESKKEARKVMLALKKLATWDDKGRCWFPCGMGAMKADGSTVPNGWNSHPAPAVEPLVTYWLVTGDREGLDFARAYAQGMIDGCQPNGIRFETDGRAAGSSGGVPHSHATMHAVWGIAHLGVATHDPEYVEFAKRVWDWMLTRGTGTGWYPAQPDSCNETCCVSDMMSIASLVGQAGHPEYFDYTERYMRNYISNLQFIVTPEFEAYYRERNQSAGEAKVNEGLDELRKFQGGIIGGSGLNDYENKLLGGVSGFQMFGCCAPEGMRAIYTTWVNTIERHPSSRFGPAGVYANMSFSRESKWGRVVSFMPDQGRLTVKASLNDTYFLRPPHWAPREQVRAFVGAKSIQVKWSGAYVGFSAGPGDELTVTYPLIGFAQEVDGLWKSSAPDLNMTFGWLGNMVTDSAPAGGRTPLFTGKPRVLPYQPPTQEGKH